MKAIKTANIYKNIQFRDKLRPKKKQTRYARRLQTEPPKDLEDPLSKFCIKAMPGQEANPQPSDKSG